MSKNLRVFLLSLLAVIFAASCAFSADIISYLEVAETDSDALRTTEEDRVEGYTFTTRFELTGYFEYTTSRGTNEVTYDMYTVDSWSVTESDDKDITWLNQYTISDDRVLILEGKLPAYSTSSDFNISVSATVSYTSGAGTTYEATPETPFETQIAVVADSAVATIEPALAYSDDTTVYFSSDVSPYAIDEKYEAYLVMPYNDEVASAYIYQDEFGSEGTQRVLLPAWLSYDIASTASITFDGEARTVITSLRFFYNDEVDYTPDDNAESSVHIIGVDTDDDMNQETTIFWNVHFGSAIHIADGTVAAISMKFGETSSDTIAYTGPDPVSYDIATDSTSTLSADELGLEIISGDGVITVTVTPTDSGSYAGVLTFADSAGKTASATLSVDVTPVITVSEDSVVVSARVTTTSSGTINIKGADLASYDISPDVPAPFGLTVTSTDRTMTLTITPSAPVDDGYTGTLTVYDDYGNSDNVSVTLSTAITGDLTISAASTTATVAAGGTTTVNFTASNAAGAVTWLGTQTSGSGLTITFDPTGTAAATITTATIAATSTATSGTISVYASAGGQTSNTETITVTVSEPTFTITPSQSSVTFDSPTSSAQTVTLSSTLSNTTYADPVVSSSSGLSPVSGLTAAISGSTLTLTPVAAGSYVVTVTGTSGTREAEATISVVVYDNAIAIDVNDLDATTQTEIAKVKALRAGGTTSATISVASYLEALESTPVVADSWVLYIGSETFTVSSSSVNSTASDWIATLTDNTTSSVRVNIIAPETISEATDIILGFTTLGTNTSGSSYEIPLATIPASGGSSPKLRSSSSSGCSAGFGALALLFAVPMFIRRKRS